MNKSELFWQTYLNLENELLELSKYVYITDEKLEYDDSNQLISQPCHTQLETFSPYIADLLVRTCVEIEAISKELYFELGGEKDRGSTNIFFDGDCLNLLNEKCKSSNKKVLVTCLSFNLINDNHKTIEPLKNAHKCKAPWERAYQAVKHDRYSSVSKGTVWNYISALGALYLLNIYYKNQKINSKFFEVSKLDFSFGSKVFSIKKPDINKYTVDVINGKEINDILVSDDSPYIIKYTDSSYHQILDAQKTEIDKRRDYINSQPELKENDFIDQLNKAFELEKKDKRQKVIISWELCRYRLNKRLPSTLPFELRKKLFVESREFNGRIRLQNNHKTANEITEENIQQEIDLAGTLAGMELEQYFENLKIVKAFQEGNCELVLDKGNVEYK